MQFDYIQLKNRCYINEIKKNIDREKKRKMITIFERCICESS